MPLTAKLLASLPVAVKIDLGGRGPDERRDLFPGRVDRGQGLLAGRVEALGIAEDIGQERPHGLEDLGTQRSRGDMIEIGSLHGLPLPGPPGLRGLSPRRRPCIDAGIPAAGLRRPRPT